MKHKIPYIVVIAAILAACGGKNVLRQEAEVLKPQAVDVVAEAQRIARDNIIIDTHVDVPFRLTEAPEDVSESTEKGDFDYPRAVQGGLNAPFMSIYTPAQLEAEGRSKAVADELIDTVEGIVAHAPDKFAIATSAADIRRHFEAGLMSMPMGMENGSPIEGDLRNLQHFYDRGIRYITPAHSLSNHLSDSSYDDNRQWNGLSDFGKDAIREMNRLGIIIDVSHVSDDAFWQIIKISQAPMIASHSSARHFTPGFERNMDDDMIVALAEQGGVIHINFGSTFINQESREYREARMAAGRQYLAEHPELTESDLYRDFPQIYEKEHGPMRYASLDDVLNHFDHVVNLAGVDHVGIGSDFDGVGDSLPEGLKDVSQYPNLIAGLLERGYSEEDIRKILGENLLRAWEAVETYAATMSSST
jgi:membrane dipeptidase